MDPEKIVQTALVSFLNDEARSALEVLGLANVEPEAPGSYLARLRFACPAYLPFATYDGSILGVHLWPGRPLEHSGVYYLPKDDQATKFICSARSDLPIGVWLWVAQYFKHRSSELRAAIATLELQIPDAHLLPAALWRLLEESPEGEPTWWSWDATSETRRAWQVGAVQHPFVDVPALGNVEDATEALQILAPHVKDHPDSAPEIVAALLACQLEAGQARDGELALRVLSAEAERGGATIFDGGWRASGAGLCEWDCTLQGLEFPDKVLKGTPFEPLLGAPETYSGTDEGGAERLVEVAARFRAKGDVAGELRQLRNAAWVEAMTSGEVSKELCLAMADSADRIAPGSLAAALARACAATPTSNA